MMPEAVKNILQSTLPAQFSSAGFKDNINNLIDAVYNELENFYSTAEQIIVTREDIKEYGMDILDGEL
jgi:hypothetical protein